jgi:hypothetical protein
MHDNRIGLQAEVALAAPPVGVPYVLLSGLPDQVDDLGPLGAADVVEVEHAANAVHVHALLGVSIRPSLLVDQSNFGAASSRVNPASSRSRRSARAS